MLHLKLSCTASRYILVGCQNTRIRDFEYKKNKKNGEEEDEGEEGKEIELKYSKTYT